jgi:NADP-dependent 3-hydroxy acid dehydrogenase YdfG
MEAKKIKSVFGVNGMGMLLIFKAALPDMQKRNEGLIHNVSWGAGITVFSNLQDYWASKGALETMI